MTKPPAQIKTMPSICDQCGARFLAQAGLAWHVYASHPREWGAGKAVAVLPAVIAK